MDGNTLTSTMFYVIGLGLSDEKDVTVKGLEVRKPFYIADGKGYQAV